MKLLCLLLSLVFAGCAQAHPRDYALRLEFEQGICSGTAVGERLVLTASHCWQGGRLMKINGQPAYALKIKHDGKDHALVRVTMKFDRWARMGAMPVQAQDVTWHGNPASQEDILRRGYVMRVRKGEAYIDAQGFGGDSGSGIFDRQGRVIGVLSGIKTWQSLTGHRFNVIVAFPLAFTAQDWSEVG